MGDKLITGKENRKSISFRLNAADLDTFKNLCHTEKQGQAEMFSKPIAVYTNCAQGENTAFNGGQLKPANLSRQVKFVARYENRITGEPLTYGSYEYVGQYLFSDFPTRQPVDARYFAKYIKTNYNTDISDDSLFVYSIWPEKIDPTADKPGNRFFLGESVKVFRRDNHLCDIRNDWFYVLDFVEAVLTKLSIYADEGQRE